VIDRLAGSVEEKAMCAVNTDSKSLAASQATTKLQIGQGVTKGLGTGGDAQLGREAAEADVEMIRGLFPETDLVMLVVALGGGTGSGAAPVILETARSTGAMTMCFATLPFGFEAADRRERAGRALDNLREVADAVVVVPNDRLFESVDDGRVADAFDKADEVLAHGVSALCLAITRPGLIDLDFADVRRVVHVGQGICALGYGDGRGKNRAERAVAHLLGSPLLEKGRLLAEARSLLVSVVGGPDLTLKEVSEVMHGISAKTENGPEILMGTVIEEEWRNRVVVTVLASGSGTVAKTAEAGQAPEPGEKRTGKKRSRLRQTQTSLRLESSGKGRFKNVEPTILDGEDLDIPTFLRRGISIDKS